MAIKDLSETAANNTSIDGVNTAEGTAMSNLNNGIRAVAAFLRQAVAGSSATVASSPTCDIASPLSNFISISGNSTINGFSAGSPGLIKWVQFGSVLNLIHSASLLCPGNANVSTLANDIAMVRYESSVITRLIGYTRSDGIPASNPVATQAQMEQATLTNLIVSPGRQHFHPGHPKAWAVIEFSGGAPSVVAAYNVSTITDNSVGDTTVTFQSALSSANHCSLPAIYDTTLSGLIKVREKLPGAVRIVTTTNSVIAQDIGFHVVTWGDI